jgi:hypothetical protein
LSGAVLRIRKCCESKIFRDDGDPGLVLQQTFFFGMTPPDLPPEEEEEFLLLPGATPEPLEQGS